MVLELGFLSSKTDACCLMSDVREETSQSAAWRKGPRQVRPPVHQMWPLQDKECEVKMKLFRSSFSSGNIIGNWCFFCFCKTLSPTCWWAICPQVTLPFPPSNMLSVTSASFFFLSINNKLQQPEAAAGVLEYAMKHFGEMVSVSFLLEEQEAATWLGKH